MIKKPEKSWFGEVKGHVSESKSFFKRDQQQREAAEKASDSIILTKKEVQGEWDTNRVLQTTLGGVARNITADDLAAFRRNMKTAQANFKGSGITARQVIDLAKSNPLEYFNQPPKSDLERARKEIHTAVPVSAHNGTIRFITNAGPDSDVSRHHVVVALNAFGDAVNKLAATAIEDNTAAKKVASWLRKEKLAFDCDCGRHRYFFRYVATIGNFAAGRPEWGYPKIRNPHLRGVACKHVIRVMTELESSNITLNFLTKHLERIRLSAKGTASTQTTQNEADETASKKSSTRIKTSEQRKAEALKAKERRAAKVAVAKAPRLKKPPAATRRIEAAIKGGKVTEELVQKMRDFGFSDAEISKKIKD